MKKSTKFIIVLFVIIILMSIIYVNHSKALINPNQYEPSPVNGKDIEVVGDKVGVVLGAIRNASVITAVLVIMGLGVKYILGSVEEKAEYKKSMLPVVIGIVLAASGITIVFYIYNVISK